MMASRQMSDCKPKKTEPFACSAKLFASQPVRPDFGGCLPLNCVFGSEQGCTGLSGEQNPYPLRM